MKRLDRYIARSLLSATLLVWLVVVALEGLFAFLGELGDIGRGSYGWPQAAGFVLLSLPAKAWQAFPMAVLIGTLLGLGNLAARGELNAFRLAGCSPLRLALSVLFAGVLMLAFAAPLGEGVAPTTSQYATSLRTQAIFTEVGVQGGNGFWVRNGRQMIQVRRAETGGRLMAIRLYSIDETPELVSATAIRTALPVADGWILKQVSRTHFDKQTVHVEHRAEVKVVELIDPQLARLLGRRPDTFSLPELMRYIEGLAQGGMQIERYQLAFWQRISAPITVLAMLLLSVGMVLSPLGRQGVGLRVLAGVLVGLLFKLGSETAAHAGLVYGGEPWLVALAPSLLVFTVAFVLMRRRF